MLPNIFHCDGARLHTLPDAPTLRTANHEQRMEHHRNLRALNADKIVPRFGTDSANDNEDCKFFTWGCEGMLEHEDLWAQCELVWSWIDERPVWVSPVHWDMEILPDPESETDRRIRFSMLGGGQITAIERFKLWQPPSVATVPDEPPVLHCFDRTLRVTGDAGDGLRRFSGALDNTGCEMGASAALFLPGTPQSIADRVAATFRLLTPPDRIDISVRSPDPDNFMALLDRSERCCVCARPLHDHVSTLLGIGPDCAKQLRLPHGLEAANRILQLRRKLLDCHSCAEPQESAS
jgi:hypothetical protein